VPEEKIVSRYYRSMNLLYEAAQHVYQAYFFDNSKEGGDHTLFAHFKLSPDGEKMWDESDLKIFPDWFKIYYSGKIKK
jgi:predicted ABC-type ATPase